MRKTSSLVLALTAAASLTTGAVLLGQPQAAAEAAKLVPPPTADVPTGNAAEATAVFAGGCFWGVQGVFQHVKGVKSAVSGYAGGNKASASYPVVSSGTTGHAESVKVTYDPRQVSYGELLRIYFSVVADPTTLNRQGPDEGPQYRSDLFTMDDAQAKVAKAYIAELQAAHVFAAPIVTKVTPYRGFYPAEAYHQNYLTRHPDDPYIAYNDIPKVEALKTFFPDRYLREPVLVTN